MLDGYLVICFFVRSSALTCGADGNSEVGWPEKSSYTVHFPSVLISMSSVKAPPMRHLVGDRGSEEPGFFFLFSFLCHQTVTKTWPLHRSRGEDCIYSLKLGGRGRLRCSTRSLNRGFVSQVWQFEEKLSAIFIIVKCWLKVIPFGRPFEKPCVLTKTVMQRVCCNSQPSSQLSCF